MTEFDGGEGMQREKAVRSGGAGIYIKYPGGREEEHISLATGLYSTNFKAEAVALQKGAAHIEHSPLSSNNVVFFSDAKSVLQALDTARDKELNDLSSALTSLCRAHTVGVQEPTYYRSGHIIDWAVYREDDLLVNSCAVNHMISSDHAAVLCTLNVARPQRQPVYRTVRDVKAIDRDAFKADITAMLQELSPDVTAQQLEDGLRRLLDKHASATERRVPSGRTSPWYSAISGQLRQAKRDRRRAERRWQKSKLTVDEKIFWTAKEAVVELVQRAKEDYWSSKIESSASTKALFSTSNRLLGKSKDSTLPTDIPTEDLSDTFSDFFSSKKPSLDPNTLKNYCPVSNLSFLSKITEKLVLSQLSDYLHSHNLFPTTQSAYRAGHSTETTLVRVMNDLLRAMDGGNLSILTLLDLSAAFDTIDHQILLDRLHLSFGLSGTALTWFQSYLSDRTQTVSAGNHTSKTSTLSLGVPQGSVLGPVLFILYTKPLSTLISHHSVSSQTFADDTQLRGSWPPDQLDSTIRRVQDCVDDVKRWMTCKKLKLNDDKTEVLLIHPKNKPLPPSVPSSISVGISSSARNLGVTFTDTLSMDKHIPNMCRSAYTEIRKISSIRHLLSFDATKTLVRSLILSKFDYCNALLTGIPQHLTDKLQKVQHSS
ncbi:uncharacterized protein [Littorina saxatilis]|uniref:uncharacterized protein n=1 Tax=Littorina saxatilis TaxID=31220 RepID=UPI0038B49C0D